MNSIKLVLLCLVLILVIGCMGCSKLESPTQPQQSITDNGSLSKKPIKDAPEEPIDTDPVVINPFVTETVIGEQDFWEPMIFEPMLAEDALEHWHAISFIPYTYDGQLILTGTVRLYVAPNSMSTGNSTWIGGECALSADSGSLTFHFEPHGLYFDPWATLELKWDKLNVELNDIVNLYYFNEDNQTWDYLSDSSQNSDDYVWSVDGKWVQITVPHFSMYSISKD